MKPLFNFYMPTRILFGPGKLKELSTIPNLPGKKALIVISSGASMKKYGYLDLVINYLKENDVKCITFDKILPNPISDHVVLGAKIAKENNCDFIIGLGGGSSIDSAKAIALMAKNPGHFWDYIDDGKGSGRGKTLLNKALPIIAIPTTAGTGTETDSCAVITKMDTNEKIGLSSDDLYPALSIIDPELMLSIPAKFTAYQGMDAFFHAVEGYLATTNQPASDLFALESVKLITKYLPEAVKEGNNIEARTAIAWASTEAGIVESLSSCLSHHSLQHALSAYYPNLPHGAGLIALSIPYFTLMANKSPERFEDLAKAMGEENLSFITALKKLIKNVGMEDLKLEDFGIKKEDIPKFAKNSIDTMGHLFKFDPCEISFKEVISIYEACF